MLRSAPVVRSEIGRRMISEGGTTGWTEEELARIVTLLRHPLPAPVRVVSRAR